ncbi:MAG: hypothetical protein IT328_25205 [Caldilineaceae bacterium]|nr:hypothetical protein [Caldilineaceae bacterium]
MWETVTDILTYIGVVLVGFLIWAALSPFELLGWWAGWFGEKIYDGGVPHHEGDQLVHDNPNGYLIFISGVGKATGETLSYREQEFLRRLGSALPDTVIISDLFPYSVNNLPLTGQPFFARLWRWALRRKLNGPVLAGYLINVRNIWQLMISADKRYGPMYNQAIAEVMVDGLRRYGYNPDDARPIFLMGYSGAGQLAVGPAIYLKEWLHAPVYIITIGGVFASNPSIDAADHLYYIYGQKDSVHSWGLLAPGRWPMTMASEWNRARRHGRVTKIDMGAMGHTGRGGYLDHKMALPDGTFYVDKTVAVISEIVERHTQHAALNSGRAALPQVETQPM